MRRNLAVLADTHHDLLVIGGGVYGAVAAWDATLRGLSVALVERDDFGAATSANSLKVVHGGLRYLQSLNVPRMRESIRERTALLRIAPHLVRPLGFLVGTYGAGRDGRVALRTALRITDTVGFDRNRGLPPASAIPDGEMLSREKCLESFPHFDSGGLTGGALWYDGQMAGSERLTLAFLIAAAERGACPVNHVAARGLIVEDGRVCGAAVQDELHGEGFDVRARVVLNAAGPWATRVAGMAGEVSAPRDRLALAQNLVCRRRFADVAVGLRSPRRDPVCGRKRYMFLAPWREGTLLGTAYRPLEAAERVPALSEADLQGHVDEWNAACPALELSLDDITFHHRGLVPLKGAAERGRAGALAEQPRIVDHEAVDGVAGLVSLSGVKYTTTRLAVEHAVDLVLRKLGRKARPCATAHTPVYGAEPGENAGAEHGPSRVVARLALHHGSRAGALAVRLTAEPRACEPLCPAATVLRGEVLHAVRDEMALHLDDVVFRRTEMGSLGCPVPAELAAAARVMAEELDWDAAREADEIERVLAAYAPLPVPRSALESRR